MNGCGIYQITCANSDKIYIGSSKSLRQRKSQHLSKFRKGNHPNRQLQNIVNKYGVGSLSFAVLFICDPADLIFFEQRAIDILHPELNESPTAGSTIGVKVSSETRLKRSIALKGITRTDEWRKNLSLALKGKPKSDEAKKKKSDSQKGKPLSRAFMDASILALKGKPKTEEHRRNISEALKGKIRTKEHCKKISEARKKASYKRNEKGQFVSGNIDETE